MKFPDFDWISAHLRMAPHTRRVPLPERAGVPPKQAGVLALIFPEDDELHIFLTLRNQKLRGHSGQVSFPGGRRDPDDQSFIETALRETCEELGICDADIQILGTLSKVYIPPSHFEVYPIVGYVSQKPRLNPNPAEVVEVFSVSLYDLINPATRQTEDWDFQGNSVTIPFYKIQHHKVWGATAVMLSELEQRIIAVIPEDIRQEFSE